MAGESDVPDRVQPQPPFGSLRRLLDAGRLTPEDVLDGGVRTSVESRSNHVVVVTVRDRPTYVLKTARSELWDQGDPAAERRFLHLLASPRRPWLPEVEAIADQEVLVTRHVGRGLGLRRAVTEGHLSVDEACTAMGRALGAVVGDPGCRVEEPGTGLSWLRARVPWLLDLAARPRPAFVTGQAEAMTLLDEVWTPEVAASLAGARAAWIPEGVMHGDVRWDNSMVGDDDGVVLVDWEDVAHGDPAWDLGCALAEHLAWGPYGAERAPDATTPVGTQLAAALRAVTPEWRLVLSAYTAAAAPDGGSLDEVLEARLGRAGALVAVRLLQVAVQWTYWSPGDPERARWVAQAATTLLADPPAVARLLL